MSLLPPGTQHRAGGSRYSCLVEVWPPSSTLSTAQGGKPTLAVCPLSVGHCAGQGYSRALPSSDSMFSSSYHAEPPLVS